MLWAPPASGDGQGHTDTPLATATSEASPVKRELH
jgi:hypothetical protein